MDQDNQAGEWLCAITWGLAICENKQIPLPPLFEQKILSLKGLSSSDIEGIKKQFANIPPWLQLAS